MVAAFYPIAFAAEQIAGDQAEVSNLTPPGSEPHDVELSVRAVERIRSADYVFYLGGGFQPAVEEAAAGADGRAVDLLPRSDAARGDPHVWLDPVRFASMVERIGDELGRRRAARRLAGQLRALDRVLAAGLSSCRRREIVTSHAAFGYLTERYDLEQIAISGLSPEGEPSPRELERAIANVERSGATTVFFEPLVSPRVARTVARETDARAAVLNPIEGLTEDELEAGETYFTVMRENLATLRRALACR